MIFTDMKGRDVQNSKTRYALIENRRLFIGGSDARVIMGNDEAALLRLWREKRGESEPEDLSGNLVVQLGVATEDLNRRWYEANSGQIIADIQRHVRHPIIRWMGATLDGRVEATGAVFDPSRREPPPRSIWPSCSITCGWWLPGRRCCR
jgi:predicted phage-related endonuclease